MTRKNYELIASVIKSIADDPALKKLTTASAMRILSLRMADKLNIDNPNSFDDARFVKACGFEL